MTDAQLNEIKPSAFASSDIRALIVKVKRLRTENARLRLIADLADVVTQRMSEQNMGFEDDPLLDDLIAALESAGYGEGEDE